MSGNVFQDRLAQKNPDKVNSIYENPFQARINSQEYKEKNDEGWLKSTARTALQIPQGLAEATAYGVGTGLQALLSGDVYDPLEIERLKEISEREGIPFDEEKYLQAAQSAQGTIPSVSNIASAIEERTGLPLEPKTNTQKFFRYASSIGKFVPKNAPSGMVRTPTTRALIGASTAGARQGLIEFGMNETAADFLAPLFLRQIKATESQGLNPSLTQRNLKQETLDLPYSRYETAENALIKLKEAESLENEAFNKALIDRKAKNKTRQKLAEEEAINLWKEKIKKNKEEIAQFNAAQEEKYQKELKQYEDVKSKTKDLEGKISPEDRIKFPKPEKPQTSLSSRKAVKSNEDLGLKIPKSISKGSVDEKIGNIFSTNKFHNTTKAGMSIKEEIGSIDKDVYKGVDDLYKISKDLNREISDIQPKLSNKLLDRIAAIEEIPDLSSVEKELVNSLKNIRKSLVEIDPTTKEITGYKPINNQTLIEQTQSLRKKIDYDFAHGNAKNIFKPLIEDIENAAIETADRVNKDAAQSLKDAKMGYRAWAEYFDNPYIRPVRDLSNKDYSRMFIGSLNPDEFNMLNEVLKLSETGKTLSAATQREIVDKYLAKFYENPRSYTSKDFRKSLNELEAIITPEQSEAILKSFEEASPKPIQFVAKEVKKPVITREVKPLPEKPQPPKKLEEKEKPPKPFSKIKPVSPSERYIAKYTKKTPEAIQEMLNSRSGIRELRNDLSKIEDGKKVFDTLVKETMERRLQNWKIKRDVKGKDLAEFFNNEQNYELFSEFIGKEETDALRLVAEQEGSKQMRGEGVKKLVKMAVGLKAYHLLFSFL